MQEQLEAIAKGLSGVASTECAGMREVDWRELRRRFWLVPS